MFIMYSVCHYINVSVLIHYRLVTVCARLPLTGPQSPCERTDLRMAIVADHLGLSWTGEVLG